MLVKFVFKAIRCLHFYLALAASSAIGRLKTWTKQNQSAIWQWHMKCLKPSEARPYETMVLQDHQKETFYQTFCWKQVSFAKVCISSIGQTSKFMEAALAVPSLPSIPPSLCWDGLRLHRCLVTSPGGETNPMHSWGVWLRLKASQKCALIWRMRGEPGWTWTCLRPFKF